MFPEVEPYNGNADDNQRYTIRRARDWCKHMAVVAEWTIDAAACREVHQAPRWYGLDHDRPDSRNGLVAPWFGDVFCNPPWSDIDPWLVKAWRAFSSVAAEQRHALKLPMLTSVSMLLPGGRTHRDWWREYVEDVRDGRVSRSLDRLLGEAPGARLTTYNPPERFPYGGPGNPEGVGVPEPNFTSVLLVWRRVGAEPPRRPKRENMRIKDMP
jgi:hypothetical protein